jgi:ubiquinone/menaquinone biosynthesis C-methylase UbiE
MMATRISALLTDIALRMFGQPRGFLGRLGGHIMARMNAECGAWVIDLLEVQARDNVLEIGFGPGVAIEQLSKRASEGHVAGVDQSKEMVAQARARNAIAIQEGLVDLWHCSVEQLPFPEDSFNKAMAVNSMQVWSDALSGLRQIRRVMKPGARIALGFTHHSGRSKQGLTETLNIAGFTNACLRETAMRARDKILRLQRAPAPETMSSGRLGFCCSARVRF